MRKRFANLYVPVSGTHRMETSPPSTISINESRRLILSPDSKERMRGAWDVRCLAESGGDITPLMHALATALRSELKSPPGGMTGIYLAQALSFSMKHGYQPHAVMGLIPTMISDKDLQIRHCGFSIISTLAKMGDEIDLFVDNLVKGAGDIAPLVREICVYALKNFAERGVPEAHTVLLALQQEGQSDFHRENCEDVRNHCLGVLESKK